MIFGSGHSKTAAKRFSVVCFCSLVAHCLSDTTCSRHNYNVFNGDDMLLERKNQIQTKLNQPNYGTTPKTKLVYIVRFYFIIRSHKHMQHGVMDFHFIWFQRNKEKTCNLILLFFVCVCRLSRVIKQTTHTQRGGEQRNQCVKKGDKKILRWWIKKTTRWNTKNYTHCTYITHFIYDDLIWAELNSM